MVVVDRTFLKGHIFDQVVLLAVTYDSNNNQILLLYVMVTSETEDTWVWFRRQLEQNLQGLMSLLRTTQRGLRVISSKVILEFRMLICMML
jgi:MULE transposase domain